MRISTNLTNIMYDLKLVAFIYVDFLDISSHARYGTCPKKQMTSDFVVLPLDHVIF